MPGADRRGEVVHGLGPHLGELALAATGPAAEQRERAGSRRAPRTPALTGRRPRDQLHAGARPPPPRRTAEHQHRSREVPVSPARRSSRSSRDGPRGASGRARRDERRGRPAAARRRAPSPRTTPTSARPRSAGRWTSMPSRSKRSRRGGMPGGADELVAVRARRPSRSRSCRSRRGRDGDDLVDAAYAVGVHAEVHHQVDRGRDRGHDEAGADVLPGQERQRAHLDQRLAGAVGVQGAPCREARR